MDDYRAYPNLTEAAEILGISTSTLSRRGLEGIRQGSKEQRLRPDEVLSEAEHHNRRPIPLVASALVRYAFEHAPESAEAVEIEVDRILVARKVSPTMDRETFLTEARRSLPRRLYAQVAGYYRTGETSRPPAMATARTDDLPVLKAAPLKRKSQVSLLATRQSPSTRERSSPQEAPERMITRE